MELVDRLDEDPAPLLARPGDAPARGLHGDLKLANVALLGDDAIALIDWQMTLRAPVAVELGWFLVSNSGSLPGAPDGGPGAPMPRRCAGTPALELRRRPQRLRRRWSATGRPRST